MKKCVVAALGAALLASISSGRAEPKLADVFQNGMVLQRDAEANIWGTAGKGEKITVNFRNKSVETQADGEGKWKLPMPTGAAGGPFVLKVAGEKELSVQDVLVGEVWLASGQSNMAFDVKNSIGGPEAVAASQDPELRFFTVKASTSTEPTSKIDGLWQAASPATTGDFSGVAYFFARMLREQLKVPVGVLSSSWGGTGVTSWISREAYASVPSSQAFYSRWKVSVDRYPERAAQYEKDLKAWNDEKAAAVANKKTFTKKPPAQPPGGPGFRNEPHVLFNAMIHPLIPYTIRGVIWYQGEGNTPFAQEYEESFIALIGDWRRRFGLGDFPFYFVQLAAFIADDKRDWPTLREAQANTLRLPNTGMAVAFDLGERDDIHPRQKRGVGERLAAIALNRTYALLRTDAGPKVKSIRADGPALLVELDPIAGQIELKNSGAGFEIAGADGKYQPAAVTLEGTTLRLASAMVSSPVHVQYIWKNFDTASVYNFEGFPAPPFRGDAQ